MTRTHRALGALGIAAALAALAVSPAGAEGVPVADGSVGAAHGMVGGEYLNIPPLAPCATGDEQHGSTDGASAEDFVSYGDGEATCSVDPETGSASVEVTAKDFRLDGLWHHYDGPIITASSMTAGCHTTETGSSSWIQVTNLSGIEVPEDIPPNHEVIIPGASPDAPPLASVTLNEVITPDPPDGSMTVNLLHVRLFPEGVAVDSADVVLGTVHCDPSAEGSH